MSCLSQYSVMRLTRDAEIRELYKVSQEECARLREGVPYVNTFTAIVDLSRSNFSIARAPLFQLKSAT